MALTGSGQLKFSEIRDEFGGSGQVKSSDLYRGGSLVRANAANNSSTNLAANVPTSGEIQVADFTVKRRVFARRTRPVPLTKTHLIFLVMTTA